jgi:hypothetical protein
MIKLDVLLKNKAINVRIIGEISKSEKTQLKNLLDHAWFKKSDVHYDKSERKLVIRMKRHEEKSKGRKRIFGFCVWDNSVPPTKSCVLTIRGIEQCEIQDDDPKNQQRAEVITGGLMLNKNDKEIYISSFCEHENPYRITLSVKEFNITLKNIRE